MNGAKFGAIVLIVIGTLGLVTGGYSVTKERNDAKVGAVELPLTEKETVKTPIWADVGVITIGTALFLFGGRKVS